MQKVSEQAVQSASIGTYAAYERRRTEETVLYQLVQEHVETFFAQVEVETEAELPYFVKAEFDAYPPLGLLTVLPCTTPLECGILAHGFLRVRCDAYHQEKLVAFSCKHRGIFPACGARRMAETAVHLVDHIIPKCRCANGL